MTNPASCAKVVARGLPFATDKINAIVLASEAAISLRAGRQTKGQETGKHSRAVRQLHRNRCALVAFVQRVNLFFFSPPGGEEKQNQPGHPSPKADHISSHCPFPVSRYIPLIACFGPFSFGGGGCFSTRHFGRPSSLTGSCASGGGAAAAGMDELRLCEVIAALSRA